MAVAGQFNLHFLMRLGAASIECELIVFVEFLVACGVVSKCIELENCVERNMYIHADDVCGGGTPMRLRLAGV